MNLSDMLDFSRPPFADTVMAEASQWKAGDKHWPGDSNAVGESACVPCQETWPCEVKRLRAIVKLQQELWGKDVDKLTDIGVAQILASGTDPERWRLALGEIRDILQRP